MTDSDTRIYTVYWWSLQDWTRERVNELDLVPPEWWKGTQKSWCIEYAHMLRSKGYKASVELEPQAEGETS